MTGKELLESIERIPIIDVHSHLSRQHPQATSLPRQVLLYHMICYPLRACGVSEETIWPGGGSVHETSDKADALLEHWKHIRRTSFGGMLAWILRDLYEFDEPLTAASLPRLEESFAARASRPDWGQEVLDRSGIVRVLSSRIDVPPLEPGQPDLGVRFTVESSPTSGWQESRTWPRRIEWIESRTKQEVTSIATLRRAVWQHYDQFDWSDKHALVNWISSEADFQPCDNATLDEIIVEARGSDLDVQDARLLEAALIRATCQAIRGRASIYQICYGCQMLQAGPPRPIVRRAEQFTSGLGWLFGEFPELHFNLLTGYEADEPILCSHALAYPNVSLSGFWWHTFYRSVMHDAWNRRLDIVPAPRLCGFFSDGWCVDWVYARAKMTRRILADVLSAKVRDGWMDEADAVDLAREILFETPRRLFLHGEQTAPGA